MKPVSTFFAHRFAFLVAALLMLASAAACKPELIANTNVEEGSDNKAVVDFIEEYRQAMESRQADKVLQLVAEEYFEDLGSDKQEDDYGIEVLRSRLADNFSHTEVLQLNLFVQKVDHYAENDRIHVFYRYLQRALVNMPAGKEWISHSDVNRIILKARGDSYADGFLIVSGL